MSTIGLTQKQKNKYLNLEHYSFIVDEVTKLNSKHTGKRNIGKTQFFKDFSVFVRAFLSNFCSIPKKITVSVIDARIKNG